MTDAQESLILKEIQNKIPLDRTLYTLGNRRGIIFGERVENLKSSFISDKSVMY